MNLINEWTANSDPVHADKATKSSRNTTSVSAHIGTQLATENTQHRPTLRTKGSSTVAANAAQASSGRAGVEPGPRPAAVAVAPEGGGGRGWGEAGEKVAWCSIRP